MFNGPLKESSTNKKQKDHSSAKTETKAVKRNQMKSCQIHPHIVTSPIGTDHDNYSRGQS